MPLRISNRKALRRPSISLTSLSLLRKVRDIAARMMNADRRYAEHDQGQLPGVEQQHRQIDDDCEKIEEGVEQPARQKIADIVRLAAACRR